MYTSLMVMLNLRYILKDLSYNTNLYEKQKNDQDKNASPWYLAEKKAKAMAHIISRLCSPENLQYGGRVLDGNPFVFPE